MGGRDDGAWENWAGLEHARPARVESPASPGAVQAAIERALTDAATIKMVGTGHSFTGIARPGHTMLRPDRLTGFVSVDRTAMTATVLAGTPLHVLNARLADLGLSLHNMGDIAEQTVAGATSTGTHGSGGRAAGLAAQLAGASMVTGTGEVLELTDSDDLWPLVAIGLGALGVLTTLTFRVEPLFVLEAHERPVPWQEFLERHDELAAGCDHLDAYWFPHTDRCMVKSNRRLGTELSLARPQSRLAAWCGEELVDNRLFGLATGLGVRRPHAVPTINRLIARGLSERRYSDVPHRVFTSPRDVRFREMEYAVPREVGLDVLRECRRAIDASDWRVGFPVEVRTAPADDVALSTATGRDTLYLAFHVPAAVDHTAYFSGVESILRAAGGRPHWGKLHSLTATDLAGLYPRFEEFLALRDRLDPDRIFANDHLRRVLGD